MLRSSRVDTTRQLAEAVADAKPRVFITASAIGYYGVSAERRFTAGDGPGGDFLARLFGTAPNPVSNRVLSKALGRVLHRPAILPAPGFALRIALGEVAGLLLEGQHVTPGRALAEGFTFRFPEIEPAFRDLLGRAPAA